MLGFRRLAPSLRSFASASTPGKTILTRNDVDFITDPTEEHLDSFMKSHGNDRSVFKKSDIAMWQKSLGKDYSFKLMCLKGTTQVIASGHTCQFRPIDETNQPMVFLGLGWADPEYRKYKVAALLGEMFRENEFSGKDNIFSHANADSNRFFNLVCEKEGCVDDEALDAGFKSYYDYQDVYIPEDFSLPKDLSFDGITVKNAKDVPKVDMINYDQQIHPYHRERYIVAHMHDKDGFGKVAYDQEGAVIGMAQAVIYPKGDCNLGPIYGDNPRVVQAMFADILKDIAASGRTVTRFEVRSNQMCSGSFKWIEPFLKCELSRHHVCSFVYHNWKPNNLEFSKVYAPTHAQLFLV